MLIRFLDCFDEQKIYLAPWRVLGIDKCAALTRAAAKHTPRKRQQEQHGKPNRKARRRGAVPANPLGDRLPLFPPRMAFFHWFLPFIAPLEFALFRSGYGSIVPRGRQRPQNRRLKHPYKRFESRVRYFPCSALLLSIRLFSTCTQRFCLCPVDFRKLDDRYY